MSADRTRNAIIARQARENALLWESAAQRDRKTARAWEDRCNALERALTRARIETEHLRAEVARLRDRLEAYNRPGMTPDAHE